MNNCDRLDVNERGTKHIVIAPDEMVVKMDDLFEMIDDDIGNHRQYISGPPIRNSKAARIGRNDLCPCGSSKKFKRCCR